MSLFNDMTTISKQHAENSGSYTFSSRLLKGSAICGHTCGCTTAEQCEFSKPAEPEPAPTVSLYNLLDHAPKDLIVAMVAFKNEAERIYDQRESSSNMADAYTSLCAWAKIFDTAINEKRDRDSEAWAEKTAKEINETL